MLGKGKNRKKEAELVLGKQDTHWREMSEHRDGSFGVVE
jgi:hypothetical protein